MPYESQIICGRYRISEKTGSGGVGVVYKAYDLHIKKYVALKLISSASDNDIENRAEADILKNLNCTYIPRISDFIKFENEIYTVMDFIDGRDFEKLISDNNRYSESQIIEWAIQLCEAAEYLHTRKPAIIHSDIKPANIMLTKDNIICLIDFNISSVLDNEKAFVKGGSINYAAPEQLLQIERSREMMKNFRISNTSDTEIGENSAVKFMLDTRTDIYSIGASLYYIFTGIVPSHKKTDFSAGNLSGSVRKILKKAMNFYPARRYQTASEMKMDFIKLKTPSGRMFASIKNTIFKEKSSNENDIYINVTAVEKNVKNKSFVPDCNAEYFSKVGNTSANCMNKGLCTSQHDMIYFVMNDGIYKKKNGENSVSISDNSAAFLNVCGKYIYYQNRSDMKKLYVMRTDGSENRILNKNSVSDIFVRDDIIFFIDCTNGRKLMKCDSEKSFESIVVDESILSYCTDGKNLYYSSKKNGYMLMQSDIYGQNSRICDKSMCNMISVYNNRIFYLAYTEKGNILKCIDGSGKSSVVINGIGLSSYQIMDKYILCLTGAKNKFSIIRYYFDRKILPAVSESFCCDINVSENELFYRNMVSGQIKYINLSEGDRS